MSSNNNFFSNFKYDFPASIVVFLVALPLCLGIALASDAPPLSGIIAGIVGGIVVGGISKSPLGVSGPAAGLASIVAGAIASLGSFEAFLVAVIIAGIIQIILGILKLGIIAFYFPNAVIKGMLAGIGVIIFSKQIPHAVGYDKDPLGDDEFLQPDGESTFSEFFNLAEHLDYMQTGAILIALISLVLLILWERPFIKKNKVLGLIPGPLLVVVLGILLTIYFDGISELSIGAEHLVNIPIGADNTSFFDGFAFPDWSYFSNPSVYGIAVLMALVASLETLLCVEATDKLDPQKRTTPPNRELIAQGTGNIIAGLIGGIPITQVIVRSSANIQSGGKTKASAVIHGIFMLVCVLSIPFVLNKIPFAALAAILMIVGYKLAKPQLFIDMYKKGWMQFLPFIITVGCVYFINLLWGIGLGLAFSILHILWNNYKTPYYQINPEDCEKGEPICIRLAEHVSFFHKASILKAFNEIPNGANVLIDASGAQTIHNDVLDIIEDFESTIEQKNITLTKVGFDNQSLEKK